MIDDIVDCIVEVMLMLDVFCCCCLVIRDQLQVSFDVFFQLVSFEYVFQVECEFVVVFVIGLVGVDDLIVVFYVVCVCEVDLEWVGVVFVEVEMVLISGLFGVYIEFGLQFENMDGEWYVLVDVVIVVFGECFVVVFVYMYLLVFCFCEVLGDDLGCLFDVGWLMDGIVMLLQLVLFFVFQQWVVIGFWVFVV